MRGLRNLEVTLWSNYMAWYEFIPRQFYCGPCPACHPFGPFLVKWSYPLVMCLLSTAQIKLYKSFRCRAPVSFSVSASSVFELEWFFLCAGLLIWDRWVNKNVAGSQIVCIHEMCWYHYECLPEHKGFGSNLCFDDLVEIIGRFQFIQSFFFPLLRFLNILCDGI